MGIAGKALRNLATIARHPTIARDYLGWLASGVRSGGRPARRLLGGIEVGNLANFSEYHSIANFIDPGERRFFESAPFGDGALIDIGANVGLVSLLLARRFPDRPIHAFEPNPSTFEALRANAARNRAAHLSAHRLAVSDAEGEVLFDNDPVKRATASIAQAAGAHTARVPATTLDAFAAAHAIGVIGLLKIDVEGYETLVLRGAARVLRAVRPAMIYFEVCPPLTLRAGFDPGEPARLLEQSGYTLSRFSPDGTLHPGRPEDAAACTLENWVAVPR